MEAPLRHLALHTAAYRSPLAAAASISLCLVAALAAHGTPSPDPERTTPSASATASNHGDAWLEHQRARFPQAMRAAHRGEDDALEQIDPDYAIYPYVEAAWLRATFSRTPADRIIAYLQRYGSARPARSLRHDWLIWLAERERWEDYLASWPGVTRPTTELRCHAVHARVAVGDPSAPDLLDDAIELWLAGHSQPDACDPVFRFLADHGTLGEALYRERIALALAERQYGLAAYLARWVDSAERDRVAHWRSTARDPRAALSRDDVASLARNDPDWLYLAFDRLAVRYADEAAERWERLAPRVEVPEDTAGAISRRIALSFSRDLSPRAASALDALGTLDDETAAWRARTGMREQDWPAVLYAIAHLSDEKQQSAQWQYWRGRALMDTARQDDAVAALQVAAADRSYHGFLAADLIGADYAFGHTPAPPDPGRQAWLAALPAVKRAHELWRVGRSLDALGEWEDATASLDVEDKAQAALLAHGWGWHPSAIATAARASLWDDLDLRFPLPYQADFERWSSRSNLSPAFALGIARSESLFFDRAVSSAGALGLMQLMPSTGRGVAARLEVDWRGRGTLFEATTNIALGTQYLSEMLERLAGHPALAAAAYNAGERRVNRWLPDSGPIPADAWIDSVPFRETRGYVRRVLMAQTIYDWKLSMRPGRPGPGERLRGRLPPVPTYESLAASRDPG
jgi:soluble lytic murein transglycosylase